VHEVIFHAERILGHTFGGSGPPSNTRYLRSTRVVIPNGISIGSAVFVWVPNAMLYTALSMGSKPPKLPLPLGISSPCRRRAEPRPQATCAEKLAKIARVVPEISSRTDRQTHRQTDVLITILRHRSCRRSNNNNNNNCYLSCSHNVATVP